MFQDIDQKYPQYEFAKHKGYPTKRGFYINMPLKSFGAITKTTHKVGCRKFLFFGFIQDYKRLDLFIHAAKQIGNAQFVIAGACNEWEKYEKIIKIVLIVIWMGIVFNFSNQGGNESSGTSSKVTESRLFSITL